MKDVSIPTKYEGTKIEGATPIENSNEAIRLTDSAFNLLKNPLIINILIIDSDVLEKSSLTSSMFELENLISETLEVVKGSLNEEENINPFLCTLKVSFEGLLSSCRAFKADITDCEKNQTMDIGQTQNDLLKFCVSAINKSQKLRDDLPNMLECSETFSFNQLKKAVEFVQDVGSHKTTASLKRFRNVRMRSMNVIRNVHTLGNLLPLCVTFSLLFFVFFH